MADCEPSLKSQERLQLFDAFRATIDDVQRAVRFEQPIGDRCAAGSLGPRQLSHIAHDIAKQNTQARLFRVFRFELSQFHFRDLSMIAGQSAKCQSVSWPEVTHSAFAILCVFASLRELPFLKTSWFTQRR